MHKGGPQDRFGFGVSAFFVKKSSVFRKVFGIPGLLGNTALQGMEMDLGAQVCEQRAFIHSPIKEENAGDERNENECRAIELSVVSFE